MSRWAGIEEFVTVVKCGSFSKAAERLNTTKSNISKKVAFLEERLGVQLIHRTGRSLSTTSIGNEYFNYSQSLITQFDNIEEAINENHEGLSGKITLSMPLGVGEVLLMPAINRFLHQYPNITIDCHIGTQCIDLFSGDYDLAFRLGQEVDDRLIARKIISTPYRLCASMKFIKSNPIHSPQDLVGASCIVYSSQFESGKSQWIFTEPETGKEIQLDFCPVIRANSVEALIRSALDGLGCMYVSEFFVKSYLENNELISLCEDWITGGNTLWAVYPHRKALSKKARTLMDFVINEID